MNTSARQQLALEIAKKSAAQAVEIMKQVRASGALDIHSKQTPQDLVTRADFEAERAIIEAIKKDWHEQYSILSEETNSNTDLRTVGANSIWVIDPVDGTVNYARGHLHSAVSIAVAWDNQVQAAVVHSAFADEVFHALRGGGAFCNGRQIQCSRTQKLSMSLIATGFPPQRDDASLRPLQGRLARVLPHIQDIRRMGSAALDVCWTALGRIEGFYEDVKPWDIAAGKLIALEAGARVGHFRDARGTLTALETELRSDAFMVANPHVFAELQNHLAE